MEHDAAQGFQTLHDEPGRRSRVSVSGWRAELKRARTRALYAPTWLWSSVVDLIAVHEAAYLEHCRRYALQLEAAA